MLMFIRVPGGQMDSVFVLGWEQTQLTSCSEEETQVIALTAAELGGMLLLCSSFYVG